MRECLAEKEDEPDDEIARGLLDQLGYHGLYEDERLVEDFTIGLLEAFFITSTSYQAPAKINGHLCHLAIIVYCYNCMVERLMEAP